MRLRKLNGSLRNWQYQIKEYTPNLQTGAYDLKYVAVNVSYTEMRFRLNLIYEREIKPGYFISISEEEFIRILGTPVEKPKVKPPLRISLRNKILVTDHFKDRAFERFYKSHGEIHGFIQRVLTDHFIVQNYEFYNGRYDKNLPSDIVVCSRDFKTIFVLRPDGNRLVFVTCYDPLNDKYQSFLDWFNDNLHLIHKLPTLRDYLED